MNKNTIILSIVSAIVIFGFLGVVYVMTNQSATPQLYPKVNVVQANDHIKWSNAKKNLLVEFSDLQCPACRAYHEIIKQQIETDKNITGKITFIYRHFPLDQHVYSHIAAYAAEAAGKQGKFFEFSDTLFTDQDEWVALKNEADAKKYFVGVAKDLKLDTTKFETDMNSEAVKQRVQDDTTAGLAANVQATPTFYLNGAKVDVKSFDELKKLLQSVK